MADAFREGRAPILSSLKTFLETGEPMPRIRHLEEQGRRRGERPRAPLADAALRLHRRLRRTERAVRPDRLRFPGSAAKRPAMLCPGAVAGLSGGLHVSGGVLRPVGGDRLLKEGESSSLGARGAYRSTAWRSVASARRHRPRLSEAGAAVRGFQWRVTKSSRRVA